MGKCPESTRESPKHPNEVWTGHNDYKSMKPYIDIVDSIKASEMSKMNFMD